MLTRKTLTASCFFLLLTFYGIAFNIDLVSADVLRDSLNDWITSDGSPAVGNGYSDILRYSADIVGADLIIWLRLGQAIPNSPKSSQLFYSVAMDTDRNTTTGRRMPSKVLNDLGVDYAVNVAFEHGAWKYRVYHFINDTLYTVANSSGSYAVSQEYVRFVFPTSQIGVFKLPSHVNAIFTTYDSDTDAWDHAPDNGAWEWGLGQSIALRTDKLNVYRGQNVTFSGSMFPAISTSIYLYY